MTTQATNAAPITSNSHQNIQFLPGGIWSEGAMGRL